MIEKIKEKSFLGNLTHIKRYSGFNLIKEESVSDHVCLMNSLAFAVVPEINKRIKENAEEYNRNHSASYIDLDKLKFIDLKDVIYRIALHDLDESITFDFPRNIKYHNPEITNAIHNTTQLILKDHLDQVFIDDINNAKDYEIREGFLVAIFDTIQAGLKIQQEIEFGNKNIKKEVKNVIGILEERRDELRELNFDMIFTEILDGIINEYIIEFKSME